MDLYQAKRVLRAPAIWYGRRRFADAPPSVRWRLEHVAYRRSSRQAWASIGADPMHLYRADLDASSVVVDVGAYTGEVAADIRDLYGCRVCAFEPAPQFYDQLARRFEDDPQVSTFPYGVGAADATLPLALAGQGSTVHGAPDEGAETVDVQIRDVDAALTDLGVDRIDFLKMNIEGAEYDVLERLFETGWNERIRYLLIQFHEWYPRADRRRWTSRRRLRATHDQVWSYPWVYELWCAKDQPHPPPPYTRAEMAQIRRELAEQRAAQAQAEPG